VYTNYTCLRGSSCPFWPRSATQHAPCGLAEGPASQPASVSSRRAERFSQRVCVLWRGCCVARLFALPRSDRVNFRYGMFCTKRYQTAFELLCKIFMANLLQRECRCSSLLQIRRPRVRFPDTTRKKNNGSGTRSTQPRDYNWGATWKKLSGSGLESREYGRRDSSRSPRGTLYPQKSWH
jgi:hypothetical protein